VDRPAFLRVARPFFGAVVAGGLALFVAAIPSRYRELMDTAEQVARAQGRLDPGGVSLPFFGPTTYAIVVLGLEVLFVLAFVTVSTLIVWRQTHRGTALLFATGLLMYALWVTPTSDALHLSAPWWLPQSFLQFVGLYLAVVFFLVFPNGVLVPSWVWVQAVVWAVYASVFTFVPHARLSLIDPFVAAVPAFLLLMLGGWGVGLVAQILRYRSHADAEQRRQTKIVVIAVFAACVGYSAVYLPGLVLTSGTAGMVYDLYAVPLFWVLAAPLPIAFTAAMLRHRLFGASTVLAQTIVVGVLAAFITGAYVAIVVGIGSRFGGRSDLLLSLAATALVAVAFQPVRARAHRFANRLVFGRRASPYEVLAEFAEHVGETVATEDLVPATARILAEGTGAREATVWLRSGDELHPHATWPVGQESHDGEAARIPVIGGAVAAPADVSLFLPVFDRGELLGALSLTKPRDERLTQTEESLARTLASEAGLVLRNVRLTEELLHRMDELTASRQRLVTAQDVERRRLERNLHDGAQQQLVALAVKAGLARSMLGRDPDAAERLLGELQEDAREANQTLRDLARGIFPAILVDEGLPAAIRAQAAKSAVPVELHADGIDRYPLDVEAAAYFCVLEALQNVTKYARATTVRVELEASQGVLRLLVVDDGVGFDASTVAMGMGLQNMQDRLAALGGQLEVRSRLGDGTTVAGSLPLESRRA
jgi:signal transduction histidine kinase